MSLASQKVLKQHTPPHPEEGFFQERACIFQQDNTKQHTVFITKVWLHNISLKKAMGQYYFPKSTVTVTSVPRRLQSSVKRRDSTQW